MSFINNYRKRSILRFDDDTLRFVFYEKLVKY